MDFYKYVKSKGFTFHPNSWGMTEYTDDGEKIKSIYELDFSNYLNDLGYKYNNGYERDVMYKDFCKIEIKSKINCDYVIHKDCNDYYIEIAGLLRFENELYRTDLRGRKEIYRNKMIKKTEIISNSGVNVLVLYSDDMRTGRYKDIVKDFLGIKEVI